jgi:allantoicase
LRPTGAATFTGLVDLAAAELGGRALAVSDDFFANVDNLLKPGRAVFRPDEYTERGKWMDGWESRRKRTPGHDWALIELGATGHVLGLDIDTGHFDGNQPAFASVEGAYAERGTELAALAQRPWRPLLSQSPLRPDAQNLFAATPTSEPVNHVRLRIYPDGGVARFRVYGRALPEWRTPRDDETCAHVPDHCVDLASVRDGARALACSDAHFGPMNDLLLPGRAANMGSGWETRRSRAPSRDWIVIELAARGVPEAIEVDTNHFRGNYPDRCAIETIDAPGAQITELIASDAWTRLLPEVPLSAHTRHFFEGELGVRHASTHVRLVIVPDGGVSRLRVWGTPAP